MATKMKTIHLTHGWRFEGDASNGFKADPVGTSNGYRVEKVVNSTEFRPDVILSKATVGDLCGSSEWTVQITSWRK